MKIIEPQSAVLSNAEVLAHLKDISARRRAQTPRHKVPPLKSPNFETVVKELMAYLDPSKRSPLPSYGSHYDAAGIRNVMQRLEKFEFTKAELMMIVNLRPLQMVFLDSIIEECDSRLTEEELGEVLEIIAENLGREEEPITEDGML